MSLRRGLLLAAAVALLAAIVLITTGRGGMQVAGFYLLFQSAACGLAVLFERRGYRPRAPNSATLRRTSERMVDPVSGKLVEVWEDPRTGTREYREVSRG